MRFQSKSFTAYETFQAQAGGNHATYATLGNHDSWPSGFKRPKHLRW